LDRAIALRFTPIGHCDSSLPGGALS
jgi:hypothetical protein